MKQLGISLLFIVLLAWCAKNINQESWEMVTSDDVIVSQEDEALVTADEIDADEFPALDLGWSATILSWIVFDGNGTEPFWGFNASGSTLVLREASDTGPMDITTYTWVVMTNSGANVNMLAPWMSLNLVLWTCSDGMSDIVYEYSSTFVAGTTSYTGCANSD